MQLTKRISLALVITLITSLVNLSNAQPYLYGLTSQGGNDFGTLFKYSAGATSMTNVYALQGNSGANPVYTQMVEAPNGLLYGMCYGGGYSNEGVIFEYNYN